MVPKKFFVVSGVGVSKISQLNAFDRALSDAGIDQCNLVPVSSVIPADSKEIKVQEPEPGSITFCVMAREDGRGGKSISAGVSWANLVDDGGGKSFGIVAEHTGAYSEESLKHELSRRLSEMAESRSLGIGDVRYEIALVDVPEDLFGCVVAALIYVME